MTLEEKADEIQREDGAAVLEFALNNALDNIGSNLTELGYGNRDDIEHDLAVALGARATAEAMVNINEARVSITAMVTDRLIKLKAMVTQFRNAIAVNIIGRTNSPIGFTPEGNVDGAPEDQVKSVLERVQNTIRKSLRDGQFVQSNVIFEYFRPGNKGDTIIS
ncbi:MAG: hypothetical protein O2904_04670, partial [bacterium]|nr:hypothetical protein [bacterium]